MDLWFRILVVAIVTGVFGMVLLVDPGGGVRLTMILTGIGFLLEGVLNLYVVLYTVKIMEGYSDRQQDIFL